MRAAPVCCPRFPPAAWPQILRNVDAPFESVNILENEALRSGMKEYSQWPT